MYATSINSICIAFSVVMMTTFVTESNADIRPGDIVTVVESGAKLMVGNNVVAELRKGTAMKVTKIQDNWIAGHVSLNGERREGWIDQDEPIAGAASLRSLIRPTRFSAGSQTVHYDVSARVYASH